MPRILSTSVAEAVRNTHPTDRLCRLWYETEWNMSPPQPWHALPRAAKEEISERVRDVFAGRLPEAEHTQGDVAVLTRGARRTWTSAAEFLPGPRGAGGVERVWTHFYDCTDWAQEAWTSSETLFGNTNVGRFHLTNLQIAGLLASDQSFLTVLWRATSPAWPSEFASLIDEVFQQTIIEMFVGDRPMLQYSLRDLLDEPRPAPIVIPIRQNFSVRVMRSKRSEQLHQALRRSIPPWARDWPDRQPVPWYTYIHLEGWRLQDVV